MFAKNFSKDLDLDDSGITLLVFYSRTNLKLYPISVTSKMGLMMICGWTTLTSQCPLENDHKRQQICRIRYEKFWVVHPVFQVCLFYTSQSCDKGWEPIKLHYLRNVWSTRFSFNVYFSANRAKNVLSARFLFSEKWMDHSFFFHVRSATFYGHFRANTVMSELSTCIPSSSSLYSWYNN